jgi:hypothetical protein
MSVGSFPRLTALFGIVGAVALGAHFFIPPHPPPINPSFTELTEFGRRYHDSILVSAWLEGIGALLYIIFVLSVVHLAEGMNRLAGWITMLSAGVILTLTLLDVAFIIAAVEAGSIGHAATATVSYDLVVNLATGDAVGHVLLIAPPLLLPLGIVILGSHVLPRVNGYLAVALGLAMAALGFVSLFAAVDTVVTVVMLGQVLWVISAAVTLIIRSSTIQETAKSL